MKNLLLYPTLALLLTFVLISGAVTAKKQQLYGKWKMVSGKTNGLPNPAVTHDRTWEFTKDFWFKGVVFINNQPRPFNQGIYMLPNDTTLVTIHADNHGNLSKIAYTYNYAIKKDTLNIYGFYMANINDNPGMLQLMYIEEKWAKIK